MRIGYLLITIFISTATSYAQNKTVASQQKKDTVGNKLKEVVVTGEYQPQSLKNSVYRTRIINAERIRLKAATSIQQVLNTELGFRFTSDPALGVSDVQMMGMSGRNIKILLDGVPMIDRNDERESLNQIDINTVERIEIVEGPLSVSYGSDALVGVINVITKKPGKETLNINARIQEETAGKEYSPFGKSGSHMQHVGGDWQNKGWSILAGLTRDDFNGFNVPGALTTSTEVALDRNRWKPKLRWMANGRLGYSNTNFNIWYRLNYLDESIDSRGGYIVNANKAINQVFTVKRYIHQLQSDYRFNEQLSLSGSVAYNILNRATKTTEHDYATGTDQLTTGQGQQDLAKLSSGAFRTTLVYKMSDQVSFQPGIEINTDHAEGARIKGEPTINDYAFFVSSELRVINGVTIRPGLRFIKNSVYDAPPVIPSLNTKIVLTDKLDLRLGYATGFRAPALRELYFDFIDANHTILGNLNLKAEQSNSLNASLSLATVEQEGVTLKTVLSGYYNYIKNRIDYLTSETDPTLSELVNLAKYKTTGGTLENTLAWKHFQASLGLGMIGTYNQYSEDSKTYGESPEFVWSPEINTNLTYNLPQYGATVNLSAKFNGTRRQYESFTGDNGQGVRLTKTGSSTIADLMITKKLLKSFALNAGVNNLFNITTLSNSSLGTGGAHGTGGQSIPTSYGRSYVVGLSFNWTKN
ncbi:outer membrane receptor for ferrienterochelin and colicins [Pedobacter cryoconitis]|uniref:Outer membrane receptor for ferrienterochelin and colicins n=1 Tax=Pedobacter cryoconitis TaxID=188932 RepID=A0A7W9DHZ6_9SPHI|nr:TonB-dependent receptor [Pedobacter cryoconitis]MBB5619194.1 outer membrane receptor for ferrienterochelin and colicins [Pedobacter cryoconitis]